MTHPRRLSFVVGTSLLALTTSVAFGCKPKHVNEGPQEPIVNEGPADPPVEEPVDEQPDTEQPDIEQPDAETPDLTADPTVDGPATVNVRTPDM